MPQAMIYLQAMMYHNILRGNLCAYRNLMLLVTGHWFWHRDLLLPGCDHCYRRQHQQSVRGHRVLWLVSGIVICIDEGYVFGSDDEGCIDWG